MPSWVTVTAHVHDNAKTQARRKANRHGARLVVIAAHRWFQDINSPSPGGVWEGKGTTNGKKKGWIRWLQDLDTGEGMHCLRKTVHGIPAHLFAPMRH